MSNNINTIKILFEQLWNQCNPDLANSLFAENFSIHFSVNTVTNIDEFKSLLNHWMAGIPDLVHEVHHYYEDGQTVIARWRGTGTHKGIFVDIAPTGKAFDYRGVSIFELDNDHKIQKAWVYSDLSDTISRLQNAESE